MIYKKSTAGTVQAKRSQFRLHYCLACQVMHVLYNFFFPARLQSKQEQPPGRSKPKNRTDPAAPRSVQNARPLQSGASARIGSRPPLTPFPSPPDREKSRRGAAARAKARYPLPPIQLISSLRFLYVFGCLSWACIASPRLSFQTAHAVCL